MVSDLPREFRQMTAGNAAADKFVSIPGFLREGVLGMTFKARSFQNLPGGFRELWQLIKAAWRLQVQGGFKLFPQSLLRLLQPPGLGVGAFGGLQAR